ncbi:MAG: phage Gp37/Gp68 family protein [Acidobacteriota bacterium]
MGDKSKIEWTDASWNPIRGCSRVSEGCRNCYAERVAARFSGEGQPYEGLAEMTPSGPRWTGEVRLIEEHLEDPLRWKKPRRIFVNSMSDLFHEKLSITHQTDVFEVMAKCPQHTFQVLTKRADLMMSRMGQIGVGIAYRLGKQSEPGFWPLRNVWLGVSVENQKTADERIPFLLRTRAAVRFISAEPLLGPIDLKSFLIGNFARKMIERFPDAAPLPQHLQPRYAPLDWIIVGGESGPGARECNLRWIESIVSQGSAAQVPVFVKQLGSRPYYEFAEPEGKQTLALRDPKGGDINEWPAHLQVRQFPEVKQ